MSLPPVEIPLGAMRFNSDSQKLEYWMGSAWMQIQTFSPNLDGGGRGLIGGGNTPGQTNTIQFVTISIAGNSQDFGDLTAARQSNLGATGNSTRGLFGGGESPVVANIDSINIKISKEIISNLWIPWLKQINCQSFLRNFL